ncbi:MAG: CBS domain-containing protein [Pseudomonadota bacterium]
MRDVNIDRIMTTDPICVSPDDIFAAAQGKLRDNAINHLPVVEGGRLVGILSASDMLRFALVEEGSPILNSIRVRTLMRENPRRISSGASLREAAEALSDGRFHALPVTHPDGTLVGIVTSTDLIRHLLKRLPTGDGSLRIAGLDGAAIEAVGADVMAVVDRARQAKSNGQDLGDAEHAVLALFERNRELDSVYQAAEHYIRSGHADREHSVLVKCLSGLSEKGSKLAL